MARQILYPGITVRLNPVIDYPVPVRGRFSKIHKHYFPSPLSINNLSEVPNKELNPVRRKARPYNEKDIRAKQAVISRDRGDRLSLRVRFIVEDDIRSKVPDCSRTFSSFYSSVRSLSIT